MRLKRRTTNGAIDKHDGATIDGNAKAHAHVAPIPCPLLVTDVVRWIRNSSSTSRRNHNNDLTRSFPGALCPALFPNDSGADSVRGVMATKRIVAGSVLIRLPVSAMITPATVLRESKIGAAIRRLAGAGAVDDAGRQTQTPLTPFETLCAFLIYESSVEDSEWAPYMATIPASYALPAFLDPSAFEDFPRRLRPRLAEEQRRLKRTFRRLRRLEKVFEGASKSGAVGEELRRCGERPGQTEKNEEKKGRERTTRQEGNKAGGEKEKERKGKKDEEEKEQSADGDVQYSSSETRRLPHENEARCEGFVENVADGEFASRDRKEDRVCLTNCGLFTSSLDGTELTFGELSAPRPSTKLLSSSSPPAQQSTSTTEPQPHSFQLPPPRSSPPPLSRPLLTWERVLWSYATVNTRSVFYEDDDSSANKILLVTGDPRCGAHIALAPFLDLLNHSPTARTKAAPSADGKALEIRTWDDYRPGEQVFISYGPHDDAALSLEYGFLSPPNPQDFIRVPVELVVNCRRRISLISFAAIERRLDLARRRNWTSGVGIDRLGFTWNAVELMRALCADFAGLEAGMGRGAAGENGAGTDWGAGVPGDRRLVTPESRAELLKLGRAVGRRLALGEEEEEEEEEEAAWEKLKSEVKNKLNILQSEEEEEEEEEENEEEGKRREKEKLATCALSRREREKEKRPSHAPARGSARSADSAAAADAAAAAWKTPMSRKESIFCRKMGLKLRLVEIDMIEKAVDGLAEL